MYVLEVLGNTYIAIVEQLMTGTKGCSLSSSLTLQIIVMRVLDSFSKDTARLSLNCLLFD